MPLKYGSNSNNGSSNNSGLDLALLRYGVRDQRTTGGDVINETDPFDATLHELYIFNQQDSYGKPIDGLNVYIRLNKPIVWVNYPGIVNGTEAYWNLSTYPIQDGQGIGLYSFTESDNSSVIGIYASRNLNKTVFDSPSIQEVNITFRFYNRTGDNCAVRIEGVEDGLVNPTVLSTFETNFPYGWYMFEYGRLEIGASCSKIQDKYYYMRGYVNVTPKQSGKIVYKPIIWVSRLTFNERGNLGVTNSLNWTKQEVGLETSEINTTSEFNWSIEVNLLKLAELHQVSYIYSDNQSPTTSTPSYFNLTPGDQLIYIWNNSLHHPSPITGNYTLTEIYPSSQETTYFFDFDNSEGAFGHHSIAIDSFIERRGWHTRGGFGTFPLPYFSALKYMVIPKEILNLNATPGQTWNESTNAYGYSINATHILTAFENVTTPAGTFYCAKVISYIYSSNTFINGTRTMWIGEPGLVKLIYNHSDGSVTRIELANTSHIPLPLDIQDISITPGNGFITVNLTWSGNGQVRLDLINFTALDTANISGSGSQTFNLYLPTNAQSDYYYLHIVDSAGYIHFGDRIYIETAQYLLILPNTPNTTIPLHQTTQIPVSIFAPTNITGINFTLLYNPSIIQIVDAETLLPSQLYTNIDNTNGTARFALILNNSISGEANILNLIVNATSPGHTDLIISGAEMSGEDFNVTPVKSFNGSVTVLSLKGDINGDGSINIADVTLVAYMVVGKTPADLKADFNGNGRVDIGDLAKIAYYMLEKIDRL